MSESVGEIWKLGERLAVWMSLPLPNGGAVECANSIAVCGQLSLALGEVEGKGSDVTDNSIR